MHFKTDEKVKKGKPKRTRLPFLILTEETVSNQFFHWEPLDKLITYKTNPNHSLRAFNEQRGRQDKIC